jgi:hypothetical protein
MLIDPAVCCLPSGKKVLASASPSKTSSRTGNVGLIELADPLPREAMEVGAFRDAFALHAAPQQSTSPGRARWNPLSY